MTEEQDKRPYFTSDVRFEVVHNSWRATIYYCVPQEDGTIKYLDASGRAFRDTKMWLAANSLPSIESATEWVAEYSKELDRIKVFMDEIESYGTYVPVKHYIDDPEIIANPWPKYSYVR